MFEVDIDGRTVKAEVTFYTAQLYEAEFRRDLIQDLFGIQTAEPSVEFDEIGENPEEIERFLENPENYITKVDFTKVSWTVVAKVLWAAIKTADPATPNYTTWMQSTKGVNLWLVQDVIGNEVTDCFFRPAAAEADEEQEPREQG